MRSSPPLEGLLHGVVRVMHMRALCAVRRMDGVAHAADTRYSNSYAGGPEADDT
jgi:hypothetical protein